MAHVRSKFGRIGVKKEKSLLKTAGFGGRGRLAPAEQGLFLLWVTSVATARFGAAGWPGLAWRWLLAE